MRTAVNNAFDGECVDQNGDERRENIRDGLAEEDLLDGQEARQDENARKEDDLAKDRKRQRDFDDAHARKAVHNLVLHAKQHGAERVNTDEPRRHGNVLTGGEMPAAIIMDAVSRLVPGVISEESPVNESFSESLLEYPQYTRPQEYDGKKVPDILISGHHAKIKKWQRYMSLKKTYEMRPDILEKANLTKDDLEMLEEIKNEK